MAAELTFEVVQTSGGQAIRPLRLDPMRDSQDPRQERPQAQRGRRNRVTLVRGMICAMVVVLAALVVAYSGELKRRARFLLSGSAKSEGLTWFLNPEDEVITQAILDTGTWEPGTTAMIRDLLKPGDTFVDVGANIGWFTLIASREVGDSGRVIAFEPDPVSFGLLRRNVAENGCGNVILEQMALSDERGVLTLYIHDTNKGSHSLFKSKNRSRRVKVQTLPLDEYLGKSEANVSLIKIDAEGAEGHILAGMQKTIQNQAHMNIVLEFAPSVLRDTGIDPAAMMSKLFESNYELFAIESSSGNLLPIGKAGIPKLIEKLDNARERDNVLLRRTSHVRK